MIRGRGWLSAVVILLAFPLLSSASTFPARSKLRIENFAALLTCPRRPARDDSFLKASENLLRFR